METFDNIFLDMSKASGRCRIADSGLGWKPSQGGDTFTLDKDEIAGAQWSRAARGYELRIHSRRSGVIQLDGFDQEDLDRAAKVLKLYFGITLENKEHALRGWNWGKTEFGKMELAFNVQNRPAFEIPYSEISNTNLAGKNEVSVEFSLPDDGEGTGTDSKLSGARAKGHKSGAARDQLTEMRFYIPGTTVTTTKKDKKVKTENGDAGSDEEDEEVEEEQNAANLFYETIMEKADIGEVAGDTIATFLDVLHLTPRGRFDVDMYDASFRMRGKTYDYKVPYDNIKKFMLLPKPDDLHTLICIGLDPPLRQGQTRYPFIVMQFKREEEVELDLNMTEETIEEKYKDKLKSHYEQSQHSIVAQVFRGLANKRIVTPSRDFMSQHQQSGVKCSVKASEGYLFFLDKSLMFVPKPAQYVSLEHVSMVVMSRVGGAISASRTFDITISMKGNQPEYQFSNINREEQNPLESFFKSKNIKVRNEMIDDSATLIAQALKDEVMGSSDDEVAARVDRGSADEDEESVDEDFHASSESDVAEEYDSAHESSGNSSGSDDGGGDDDDEDEEMADADEEERPKKKAKKST